MGTTTYETDVINWSKEQARLLRNGRFDALDIEHIADEIEDVGKSEQRELESRMAVLLSHLLKWQHQPERRGSSWQRTIKEQRKSIARRICKTPSLKSDLQDAEWWESVWGDALIKAADETGIAFDLLPTSCPWTEQQVFSADFFPDLA
ncbi:MAG: DUF29 domain-containing protein [Proteobacteria bacterium]|nr:DUF29 domain-containing protein [Pseudomonadota bacterium]